MNSRTILLLAIITSFLFTARIVLAQPFNKPAASVVQKVTLYYNGGAELTSRQAASFKRMVDMNITAMIFDGVYQDFDLNDNLIAEGYFHQGHKRGLHTTYFADRSVKSVIEYLDDDFVIWQMKNADKQDMVLNGSGTFNIPFFFATGTTFQPKWKQGTMEGEFKFGKRVGVWKYFDVAKVLLDEEFYENGKFMHRIHYDAGNAVELDYRKGITLSLSTLLEETMAFDQLSFNNANMAIEKELTYPPSFKRPPTFAGGLKRLLGLLVLRNSIPENTSLWLRANINEEGLLTSVVVQQGVSRQVDAAFVEVVRSVDKKFFPAIKNGKPYSSTLYIPIYGGTYGLTLIKDLPFDFIQEE